jgi:hypothetical protein
MEMILWGVLGGAVVLVADKFGVVRQAARVACGKGFAPLSAAAFYYYETIERLKDLAAESKMEFEAERAAIEEVRLHSKDQRETPARKKGQLVLLKTGAAK